MPYSLPTGDFVTTSLSGVLAAGATSATVGTGLTLPAANGILHLSYDTANAVGAVDGPETVSYATYASLTGALTGMVRGLAGTADVQHSSGQSVQSTISAAHLTDLDKIVAATALTTFSSVITGFSPAATQNFRYQQLGKIMFLEFSFYGTSNGTGCTFTLPAAPKVAKQYGPFFGKDNSVNLTAGGYILTAAGNSTAIAYSSASSATWTAAGTKMLEGMFIYETN